MSGRGELTGVDAVPCIIAVHYACVIAGCDPNMANTRNWRTHEVLEKVAGKKLHGPQAEVAVEPDISRR
jgi:hypothetical protein